MREGYNANMKKNMFRIILTLYFSKYSDYFLRYFIALTPFNGFDTFLYTF